MPRHPASRHATSRHVMPRHITSRHVTTRQVTIRHVTPHRITSPYLMTHHVTPHHSTSHPLTSHHVMSHHAMLCHVTSCHAMSHHPMSCHATTHHIMPHHVTSRHVMPRLSVFQARTYSPFMILVILLWDQCWVVFTGHLIRGLAIARMNGKLGDWMAESYLGFEILGEYALLYSCYTMLYCMRSLSRLNFYDSNKLTNIESIIHILSVVCWLMAYLKCGCDLVAVVII